MSRLEVMTWAPEIVALAKAEKIHPAEVEICEWCEQPAPPRHAECEKRPPGECVMFFGSFSPSKAYQKRGRRFTWHTTKSGWRVYLSAPKEHHARIVQVQATVTPEGFYSTLGRSRQGHFDLHVWPPLVFGQDPRRARSEEVDQIRFEAMVELQPWFRPTQTSTEGLDR